jgi:hypothetical protein
MKKSLVALAALMLAVQMGFQTTLTFAGPSAIVVSANNVGLSQQMRNIYKVTEHPEFDQYVYDAFDKIEANKYSSSPIIVYTGDYQSCWAFRDYFNYAYGFTYDFRLSAYRTSGSANYVVAFCNTGDMDTKIENYLNEVYKAQSIAAQLAGPDTDTTAYNIFNWVKSNLKYDYSLHGKATDDEMLRSYYGFYSGNPTICKGFSMAVYQLCSMNGIKATLEAGSYNGGGHAWNTVLMSDGLKYVDVLNDQSMISSTLLPGYVKE